MRNFLWLFSLSFLGWIPQYCVAQTLSDSIELSFESIGINEGLSQGMVRSMVQTNDGLMWFATKDGLNKYDGYQFTVFRNSPTDSTSVQCNYITALAENAQGNLITATAGKELYLFNPKTELFYPIQIKSTRMKESVNVIYMKIRKEGLIIATRQYLLYFNTEAISDLSSSKSSYDISPSSCIRLNQLSEPMYPNELAHSTFRWMNDGTLWCFFLGKVFIYQIDSRGELQLKQTIHWKEIGITNTPTNYISGCETNHTHQYFLYSDRWMCLYDLQTNKVLYQRDQVKPSTNMFHYAIQLNDSSILYNEGSKHLRFNTNAYSVSFIKESAFLNRLIGSSHLIDNNKNLWIGTLGHGLLKLNYTKQLFHTINKDKAVLQNNMAGEALFVIDGITYRLNESSKQFERIITHNNSFPPNFFATTIYANKTGQYWIKGSNQNMHVKRLLYNFDQNTNSAKTYHILDSFPGRFERLFIDKQHRIWIIFIGDNLHWKLRQLDTVQDRIISEYEFPVENQISDYSFVSEWWQDEENKFWFATMVGLFCFDETKNNWQYYKHDRSNSKSLSSNSLFSLCADPKQPQRYLWIGTNGYGLNRFDRNTHECLRFTEQHGLPNQVIYGILADTSGYLWLSTNMGICSFSTIDYSIRAFSESDGIASNESNRYEYQTLSSGNLLFGGVNGYTLFNPYEVMKSDVQTHVIFTRLSVLNKVVNWKLQSEILKQPIQYATSITLPYSKNMFSIEFASLEYREHSKLHYVYYLKGFNDTWISSGNQNSATFTNLNPGTYTFYAAACDVNGKIISNQSHLEIHILTPWWQTWWFRGSMLLLFVGSVYALYRYRLKQLHNMYMLRNRIATDLHDEIGSTLSSISLSSSLIQKKLETDNVEAEKLLKRISSNTNQMMEAMSDIVWAINAGNDRFDQVFNRMRAYATETLEPQHIHLVMNVDERLRSHKLNMVQRKNWYLLFKEAIHNISKYAKASQVTIHIQQTESKHIDMIITDNGVGFDSAKKDTMNLGGNGIESMLHRAKELQGELHIESKVGHGTSIHLRFVV